MLQLEELKSELQINTELTEIVDALKVIAVTQFRELEERRKQRSSVFLDAFEGFFRMIDFSSAEHPYAKDTTGRLVLLILTSDERFMGGLNKRVVDTALAYPDADAAALVVVGIQGCDYLRSLHREFTGITDVTSKRPYDAAVRLRELILGGDMRDERDVGRLVIVYPKPVSFLIQAVETLPVLPCTELLSLEQQELERHDEYFEPREDVLCESSLDKLVVYLFGTWITEKLLEVMEDSRQAELSAKAVRLEESYQTLLDNRKSLVHQYHRTHHELLDKGMRETFSAQIMRR